MKTIRRGFPSRECGSRGKKCVLRGPVSWLGLDDPCIHIHRPSVRMDRSWASRRRISNHRECWFITRISAQTIFRFLVAGKRSRGLGDQDEHSPATQACFATLQRSERRRAGLRLIQIHDRKARTNIRVCSEELESMVALGNIYGLCERQRFAFGRGWGAKGKKLQKLTALYLLSSVNAD